MIAADRVAALLLAAGESRRFGSADKLAAPLGDRMLAAHAAHVIADGGFGASIAVCRAGSERTIDLVAGLGFAVAINEAPIRGMSRSLALGVSRAADCDVDAVLVCLADMPFINAGHLRGLLDRFDMSGATIVASAYDGIATPPALFARRHFPTLAALEGDRGARSLLQGALLVPASRRSLADIDTPADLEAVTRGIVKPNHHMLGLKNT